MVEKSVFYYKTMCINEIEQISNTDYLNDFEDSENKTNCNLWLEEGFQLFSEIDIDVEKIFVTKEIINKITDLETSPNVLGVCSINEYNRLSGDKYLLLDNIQDPGNLGTIIRSAKAFNIDTIVLSQDTVDLYNPKVVRATQGIMFHINIVVADLEMIILDLKKNKIKIFGTDVESGISPSSITSKDKDRFALVMGNEGQGVKASIKECCDENIYIPISDEVESLNVAVATSIILYEFSRR